MNLRGYDHTPPADLTMSDFEAAAQRLGRVVITNGNDFAYAEPGQVPAGWRNFRMVDRQRSFKRTPDDVQ